MSEELHPEQIKALRKMTPARRLELSLGFIEQMRELRAAMLRTEHPDWSAEDIAQALRDFVGNARS
jgi:DNA-binding transcriptional regulator WhiA